MVWKFHKGRESPDKKITESQSSLNAVSKSLLVAWTKLIDAHAVSIGWGSTTTFFNDDGTWELFEWM